MSQDKDFYEQVYYFVRRIPAGKVSTYGHIAASIGLKSSARMVGFALNAAKNRNDIPCHRVVNRLGELSGKRYFATPTMMEELLRSEGIPFKGDSVDLIKCLWMPVDDT